VDAHQHFVHVFASIMEGRTQEQKKGLSDRVVRLLLEMFPDAAGHFHEAAFEDLERDPIGQIRQI